MRYSAPPQQMADPVTITFKNGLDWPYLAQQKEDLLQAAIATGKDTLADLLPLIDEIQDIAAESGHPVIYLTEDDDE